MTDTSTWIHEPKQARSAYTLDRIVSAAGTLLDEKNFDDITIAEIMSRAGMSVGSFYTRFPNKAALLPYLYEKYDEELSELTTTILDPSSWAGLALTKRVQRLVGFGVDSYRAHRGLWRAILIHASSDPSIVTEAHGQRRRKMVQDIVRLLLECRSEISHPKPDQAVEFGLILLFSCCKDQILLEERSHGTARFSDGQLKKQLTRTLLTYLGVPDGHRFG